MVKLTFLLALVALCVPCWEAYEFHPSSRTYKERQEEERVRAQTELIKPDQDTPATAATAEESNEGSSLVERFLLRGQRSLWGSGGSSSSSGGCRRSLFRFWTSCSNRDQYTTGNTSGGGNSPPRPNTIRPGNLIQVLESERSEFSILLALLKVAGLEDTLEGDGSFTLFAPRNSAFIGMDAVAIQSDVPLLQKILTYHVIGEEIMATEMVTGQELMTLQGGNITLTVDTSIPSVKINGDEANVVMVDMEASNGVVHTIDEVLEPPSARRDLEQQQISI